MILPTHDLRCHVAWCPTCLLGVVWVPDPRDSKISDSQVTQFVEYEILWFDIPMQDAFPMNVIQSYYDASHEELSLVLWEPPVPRNVISEVSSSQ